MDYYRSSELYHHGILGMKWGVRRFQNKDGTYTNAGKARRNKTHNDNVVNFYKVHPELRKKNKTDNVVDFYKVHPELRSKNSLEEMQTTKKQIDEAKKQVDTARQSIQQTKKPRMDLSNMTNQQLQDRITRENLERQYNQMFAPDPKGKEVADSVLKYGSMALTATSSALALAISIKQLKGE